jgi:hypothetical protein
MESDPNVLEGRDNYVYLRVWDRGRQTRDVTATVFWSPPATLVAPTMWTLIGSALFTAIPHETFWGSQGMGVQVSDPGITWAKAKIPGPGHYCFVATVGNDEEPAPSPTTFTSFGDYFDYILAHNNITWRNFNVVGGQQVKRQVELPFFITGAWDDHTFALQAVGRLPEGSRMALQVPDWIGQALQPGSKKLDGERLITIQPTGLQRLGEIRLPPKTCELSQLFVYIPAEHRHRSYDVAIRQMYRGREVGRVSWRLMPERVHLPPSEPRVHPAET